jgi:dTDP-4-amino-4,6-dideoxygalactose transaminase
MSSLNSFDKIFEFEKMLAEFTGAPYAVMTDCCTHAIELCLRYDKIKTCSFTPFTYLSIPMTMHKLGITYEYYPDNLPHRQQWVGEYKFELTRIWDSARRLEKNMYKSGSLMCLSFGHTKPLNIGRGGAILLDDVEDYDIIRQMRYDGRDLLVSPWEDQQVFRVGYHYKPTIEEATKGIELLSTYKSSPPVFVKYPDCRKITII